MQLRRWLAMSATLGLLSGALAVSPAAAAASPAAGATSTTRTISAAGTTSFGNTASASDTGVRQFAEIARGMDGDAAGSGGTSPSGPSLDRSKSDGKPGKSKPTQGAKDTKPGPELKASFDGLNHRQQRLANGDFASAMGSSLRPSTT